MNLFDFPSIKELNELLFSCEFLNQNFDIIVDYDGEVIVKSSGENSKDQLGKYKFYFLQLNNENNQGVVEFMNRVHLNYLYQRLLHCWKNNLKGEITYDSSSLNAIKYRPEPTSIFSVFNCVRNHHISQLNN